jgi:GNAT superfamily N-acetyltransferase
MQQYDVLQNNFLISTDKSKIDIDVVHNYLCNESYWAKNISLSIVQTSIQHSFCFGVYAINIETKNIEQQIGFARVITDCATFGYLADVFILKEYRGKGLSKWLMQTILAHPQLQGFRRWMLATLDAHGLYQQFGFLPINNPERYMRLTVAENY